MTKRLTAEQVAAEIARAKNSSIADAQRATCRAVQLSLRMEANALGYAESRVRENLVPHYIPMTDDMPEGWYWCEELAADAPPQKVVRCNRGVDSEGNEIGGVWRRWTTSGWVDLTGRVCPIGERPQ